VGNYDLAPPPLRMLEVAVRRVLLPVMHRHGITAERVIGHRDAGLMAGFDWRKGEYKTCPGRAFDLEVLRRLVR
jgi:N-acetyl-anhydromuramyl-L-alanine amidase AmpD